MRGTVNCGTCSTSGCDELAKVRGLCKSHYKRRWLWNRPFNVGEVPYRPTLDLTVPTVRYEMLRRACRLPFRTVNRGVVMGRREDEWMLGINPVQGWLPRPTETDVSIYGLFDPETGALRYIGQTLRLRERYENHCNEKTNTHRSHWIQALRRKGLRPIPCVLEWLPDGSGWADVERAWIAAARAAGCRLVNGTDGGDGVNGMPEESRRRIRETWIGRKHTNETKLLIGAKSKGRRHSQESRDRMRDLMTGREFTPEWREKISAGLRKLTPGQAAEIRALRAAGVPRKEVATRFGVSQDTVLNVCRGRYYPIEVAP